jgi:hypothetical protein
MASLRGFKKTLSGAADVDGLTALAKTYALAAGFAQTSDDGVTFEFRPVWAEGDSDDAPRWAFGYGGSPNVYARRILAGTTYSAQLAIFGRNTPGVPWDNEAQAGDVVYCVFDGIKGTFWTLSYRPSTARCEVGCVGATFVRVPADYTQGIAARFALLDLTAHWSREMYLPYQLTQDGAGVTEASYLYTVSPAVGDFGKLAPNTLPRMAAQLWPLMVSDSEAIFVSGPLSGVLATSSDFALEEEVLPGYRALPGRNGKWYALPWPDTLDVL